VAEAREAGEKSLSIAESGGSRVFRVLNLWALGFLALSVGDARRADGLLRDLPGELEAMGYRNPGVRPVYADAVEARIAAGDLDVEPLIDQLEDRGRAMDNPWARAAAARCRGLLTAARGDGAGAVGELERALAEQERSPLPLERGRTLLGLGTAQRRANRRRDARTSLQGALDVFERIGAALWATRARTELGRIGGRAASGTDLTGSERRVSELVARGMTNREVAEALYLSEHTVESHRSSAYRKLGSAPAPSSLRSWSAEQQTSGVSGIPRRGAEPRVPRARRRASAQVPGRTVRPRILGRDAAGARGRPGAGGAAGR